MCCHTRTQHSLSKAPTNGGDAADAVGHDIFLIDFNVKYFYKKVKSLYSERAGWNLARVIAQCGSDNSKSDF